MHTPDSPYWRKPEPKISPPEVPAELPSLLEAFQSLSVAPENFEIEGLDITLMPHQIEGIQWLQQKEKMEKSGCILADDMGLGKTIQIIGLILASKPKDPWATKTTLIVAPVSLLAQWKKEITSKTNPPLSVLIHHGPTRTNEVRALLRYDVVLTTYGLVTSCLKEDAPGKGKENKITLDGLGDEEIGGGALLGAEFYRVVLDEAHTIKNQKSKGSRACSQIKANKRICMTGTPIHNNIDELYSLIRFLRIPSYERLVDFKRIANNPTGLQNLLSGIMLRRTKKGLALDSDAPLKTLIRPESKPSSSVSSAAPSTSKSNSDAFTIHLPEKTIFEVQIHLSSQESEYYKRVEESGQLKIKNAQKADSLNRMVILALLLRLRQICNHTLLPSISSQGLNVDDVVFNDIKPIPVVKQEPKPLLTRPWNIPSECAVPIDEIDSLDDLIGQMSLGTNKGTRSEPKVANPFTLPWEEKPRVLPSFKKAPTPPVTEIKTEIKPLSFNTPRSNVVIDLTGSSDEEEEVESFHEPITTSAPSCVSCGLTLFDPSPDSLCDDCYTVNSSLAEEESLADLSSLSGFKLSSKFSKILEIIESRLKVAPAEKFIVFSQWTSTFKVLNVALQQKGIQFIQYDGKMSGKTKADALQRFEKNPKITVCLMSLMCGAVGLNLTCANNVILTDLWWNPMLEDQAIDRVYRIGQKKPVFVHRMIVADSVEERIFALQNKKRELVESTIGGKEGFKAKSLSIGDLMSLFGI
ncbi:hypothetical protein HDU98_011648 [Podochytrium sp. JEL0797]|nr:hypothetical protein HDU98_011648 [Podochytrium sp. JEL0797]